MYRTPLEFFYDECVTLPINDIGLAKNYLYENYGGCLITKNKIAKMLTFECLITLVDCGHLVRIGDCFKLK